MPASESFAAMEQAVSQRPESSSPVGEIAQLCPLANNARIRLVVKDDTFTILRNRRYTLVVGAEHFEGTTGTDGLIDHKVAASATRGKLRVWTDPEDDEPMCWELALGAFAPLEVDSGLRARLANLGFLLPETRQSSPLRGFWRELGLEDASDDEARAALARLYSQSEQYKVEPHTWWVPEALAKEGSEED